MIQENPGKHPIFSIECELTSELATNIERTLLRLELRRGWRRDLPAFAAAGVFAAKILSLGLLGLIEPGVRSALLGLLTLFVMGTVWRCWSVSRMATFTALLALNTSDRRVRIEFAAERVRLETEYIRGEGVWTELDEVVALPDFWVLRLSNGRLVVVPGDLVSPELETFLRAQAQLIMAPIRRG